MPWFCKMLVFFLHFIVNCYYFKKYHGFIYDNHTCCGFIRVIYTFLYVVSYVTRMYCVLLCGMHIFLVHSVDMYVYIRNAHKTHVFHWLCTHICMYLYTRLRMSLRQTNCFIRVCSITPCAWICNTICML